MHTYSSANAADEKAPIGVGIVGATGYSGLELARLLKHHPFAALRVCFSTQKATNLRDFLPTQYGRTVPVVPTDEIENWAAQLKVVFLATPAETSAHLAPRILAKGAHVVDLSGAFRLKGETPDVALSLYKEWYGFTHPCPDLLPRAEYGLCPWVSTTPSTAPRLVANPGCYATAVLMAILPLLHRGLIRAESLVIDAKSGASGAGRKASESLLFTEVDGECLPYRIGRHQHLPEIREHARALGGLPLDPFFSTHLLPVRRGILCSMYARLSDGVRASDLPAAYAQAYSNYGLVDFGEIGADGDLADAADLSLKKIVGTGMTRIRYKIVHDRLYVFSLLDNLIKGAAGQAIENLNRLYGQPLAKGLDQLEAAL